MLVSKKIEIAFDLEPAISWARPVEISILTVSSRFCFAFLMAVSSSWLYCLAVVTVRVVGDVNVISLEEANRIILSPVVEVG